MRSARAPRSTRSHCGQRRGIIVAQLRAVRYSLSQSPSEQSPRIDRLLAAVSELQRRRESNPAIEFQLSNYDVKHAAESGTCARVRNA